METLDLEDVVDPLREANERPRLAFVLLWSREEPDRVGEVAFLPERPPGGVALLGRAAPGEDPAGKLRWERQRPGGGEDRGGLEAPTLSREQLAIRPEPGGARVENQGRGRLLVNGVEVGSAGVGPGDVLEVSQRLVLLCTRRPRRMSGAVATEHPFGGPDALGIVGESPAVWQLREQLGFLARRTDHVLVRGASGTGKELVAQALHALSPRRTRPLVSRNAATIPATLIDAELFGNTRNYPNPGMPERPGLIGEASGSTLFLDEFAELPVEQQAHLLRVLDGGEYHRLGEARARRADLRLVAATNRPDEAFKADVLARFKLRLEVPGLDARREDVPLLAAQLLRRLVAADPELAATLPSGAAPDAPLLTPGLVTALVRHPWTTHVRELEALLWQAILRRRSGPLDVWEGFPAGVQGATEAEPPAPAAEPVGPAGTDPNTLDPALIQACLDKHGGKQEPVWRELGLSSRHALTRLVKKHGLQVRGRARP